MMVRATAKHHADASHWLADRQTARVKGETLQEIALGQDEKGCACVNDLEQALQINHDRKTWTREGCMRTT